MARQIAVAAPVTYVEPTPAEKFDRLVRLTDRRIEEARDTLAAFAAKLTEHPDHTLTWGMEAFRAAASFKVNAIVKQWLDAAADDANDNVTPENVVEKITEHFTRDALSAARNPSRSTSPTSNLMEQEIASAKAEWLDKERWI